MADSLGSLGVAYVDVQINLEKAKQQVVEFGEYFKMAAQDNAGLQNVADQLGRVGSQLRTVGIGLSAALTAPIALVGALGISFNALQEQATLSFTTMLGSATKAQTFLAGMKDFAAKTPFEFPDLIKASQRMLAYGFAAKDILPILTSIGDASSMLGGSPETINRITLALGQIKAKGALSAEEMRQLAEAGIPAWEIVATKLGVTIPQAMKMTEARAIDATTAINALVSGMNDRFAGGMERASRSWTGLMSTIADESRFMAGALTEGVFNALKGPLESLTTGMHGLRTEIEAMPDGMKLAIAGVAIFAALIGPAVLVLGTLAGSISSLITLWGTISAGITAASLAFPALTVAITGTAAALAGPLAIAVGAIALGALAIEALGLHDAFYGLIGDVWEFGKAATSAAWTFLSDGMSTIGNAIRTLVSSSEFKTFLAFMKFASGFDAIAGLGKSAMNAGRNLVQSGSERLEGYTDSHFFAERSTGTGKGGLYAGALEADETARYFGPRSTGTGGAGDIFAAREAALLKIKTAADQAQQATDKVLKGFGESLAPADELNKTIGQLHQKFSDTNIVSVYAQEIIKAADTQRQHGLAVTGDVARLEGWARAAVAAEIEADKTEKAVAKLKDAFNRHVEPLPMDALGAGLRENLNANFPEIPIQRTGLPANVQTGVYGMDAGLQKVAQSEKDATQHAAALSETMRQMRVEGYTAAEILSRLGGELDQAASDSKRFGFALDPQTQQLVAMADAAKKSAAEAEQWNNAWSTAMGNLASNFAKGMSDVLFHAKSMGGTLKGIFSQFAHSITDTFFLELFHPLQTMLSQLGKNLAASLGHVLFGGASPSGGLFGGLGGLFSGGGQGGGGLMGKLGGLFGMGGGGGQGAGGILGNGLLSKGVSALGGILGFGGAASAAGLTATIGSATVLTGGALTAPTIAAPALLGGAGGLGGLGATMGALATNPVTIAAAAAIGVGLIAKHFIGRGRKTANHWVQEAQNPFGQTLANIMDPVNAKQAAGTLTKADVNKAQSLLNVAWSDYQQAGTAFAGQGKNEAKVWAQALATANPTMLSLRTTLETDAAGLAKPGTAGAKAGAPAVNITIKEGDITIHAPASTAGDIRTAVMSGVKTNRDGFLEQLTDAIKKAWPGIVTTPNPA